jgi:1-acyl-sn-glycerol-3-phosphate acyltransferase
MRNLAAIPRTLLTLLSGVVATIVLGTAAIAVGHFRPTSPIVQRIIELWSKAWLAPAGVRLEIEGSENVDPNESYVVVANHLSNMDVMVCFTAVPVPIRYLAKKELFSVPLLAQAMRAVGMVEVDRQHRGTATIESVNRQSRHVIERGHSLIIYPEGTRSRSGEPQPFKKGAFTMAAAAGMPLLPLTIHGTREVWAPASPWIHPGTVRVVIDPPVPTADATKTEVAELRARMEGQIHGRYRALQVTVRDGHGSAGT